MATRHERKPTIDSRLFSHYTLPLLCCFTQGAICLTCLLLLYCFLIVNVVFIFMPIIGVGRSPNVPRGNENCISRFMLIYILRNSGKRTNNPLVKLIKIAMLNFCIVNKYMGREKRLWFYIAVHHCKCNTEINNPCCLINVILSSKRLC